MITDLAAAKKDFRPMRAFLISFLTMELIGVSAAMVQLMAYQFEEGQWRGESFEECVARMVSAETAGIGGIIAILASVPVSLHAVAVAQIFSHGKWSRRLLPALAFSAGTVGGMCFLGLGLLVLLLRTGEAWDAYFLEMILRILIPCLMGAVGSTWAVWRFYKIVERTDG